MRDDIRMDEVKSTWQRRNYLINGDWIEPVIESKLESYKPFDIYNVSHLRNSESPHLEFAFLNTEDNAAIEMFCSKWGPLGLFDNQIERIVEIPHLDDSGAYLPGKAPFAGVHREKYENELVPLDELIRKYRINPDGFSFTDYDDSDKKSFRKVDTFDTIETVTEFKKECEKFKAIMELKTAFVENDHQKMLELYLLMYGKYFSPEDIPSKKDISTYVLPQLNRTLIGELRERITPLIGRENDNPLMYWHCDTLLTSMYLMMFLDITNSNITRRCNKCRRWFATKNVKANYCSDSCQNSAKQVRRRNKPKKLEGAVENG